MWTLLLGVINNAYTQPDQGVTFRSNDAELNEAFRWAKDRALSFAANGSDPVGYWYEAALPGREAFCMRDVSHQSIGAEILGLAKHNFNMHQKFAQNISESKDYCTFWEINRYDKPAPVDYLNDNFFWYNLTGTFDVIYSVYRLFRWTGNVDYITHPDLKNYYELSLNEFVERWKLSYDEVLGRDRHIHEINTSDKSKPFFLKRGIPSYKEFGREEVFLGIDLTASMIASYRAYGDMLRHSGYQDKAEIYVKRAQEEEDFLNDFWWDPQKRAYASLYYTDKTFDYFLVDGNQAYLHYLLYFDVLNDPEKVESLMKKYVENYDKLIIELQTYLPLIFYENGNTAIANDLIVKMCSPSNKRRNYPENSFTVIEHITRGLMGLDADAGRGKISTLSRLQEENDWAEMQNIPVLSNLLSVRHTGQVETTIKNKKGPQATWECRMKGNHPFLFVNGEKVQAAYDQNSDYSSIEWMIESGEQIKVTTHVR